MCRGRNEPVLIYVNVKGMYSFGRETCENSRLGGEERKKRKRKKVTGKLMCKLRVDSDSLLRHLPELLCAAVIRESQLF